VLTKLSGTWDRHRDSIAKRQVRWRSAAEANPAPRPRDWESDGRDHQRDLAFPNPLSTRCCLSCSGKADVGGFLYPQVAPRGGRAWKRV